MLNVRRRLGRQGAMPLVAALIGAVAPGAAAASQRVPGGDGDSVTGRARPEYDVIGVGLGGFTLYPQLSLDLSFDDNVYRTVAPKRADAFAALRPRVLLESRSPRYPLAIEATATIRRYARLETEDSGQYSITGSGGAEVSNGTRLTAQASYARALEPRGSAGDLFVGGRPIAYHLAEASVGATRDVGRIAIIAGGEVSRYTYRPTQVGGVRVSQAFRDYRTRGGSLRIAYAASPAIAVFMLGRIDRSTYPNSRGLDRNSSGYSIIGGVQFGITSLLSGSAGVGYLSERFGDPAFGDIAGLDYDLALAWNPTPLVSVSVKGQRSLQRSPFIGAAGGISSRLSLGADYELLRQLILSSGIDYSRDAFRGFDRRDSRIEGRIGARYLVSRLIGVSLAMNYRRQASSGTGARDFDGFGATLGVTVHR